MTKEMQFRKTVIAVCTALALCAGGTVCYAANVGGIQRTVQVWLHGDQTTATLTVTKGKGNVSHYRVKDRNGKVIEQGGGVAIEDNGEERPLTDSEIQEDLNDPTTETINGRRYLFYKDQQIDLTGKFDKDGLCYITLKDGKKKIYVTVTENGGLSSNPDRYTEKNELPKSWFQDN